MFRPPATSRSGWNPLDGAASNAPMKDGGKTTRWDAGRLGVMLSPQLRPAHWRSRDLKGPPPFHVVRAMETVVKSLPSRGPWSEIDEEAWWKDVLADQRARPPAAKAFSERHAHAALRLDRLPTRSLIFACACCGRHVTVAVADLCARFDPDRNVKTIGQDVLACKEKARRRDCGECPVNYQA